MQCVADSLPEKRLWLYVQQTIVFKILLAKL